MTASHRIRNYLSNLNPCTKSSIGRTTTAAASDAEHQSNGNGTGNGGVGRTRNSPGVGRRSARPARGSTTTTATASTRQQPPPRRLQRGWWPDAQKRAERSFKAMEDLREETFVITDDNLEWEFDDTNNNTTDSSELQCHLILPADNHSNSKTCKQHNNGRISNECAICMVEYDLGDVVIHSRTCCHVFHQDCILDWISRENKNKNCPVCRSVFYDPTNSKKKKKNKSSSSDRLQNNGGDGSDEERDDDHNDIRRRSRSDTADTDTLSEYGGSGERQETSSDGGDNSNSNAASGLLESVLENDAVEV